MILLPILEKLELIEVSETELRYDVTFIGGEHISKVREFCQKYADDTDINVTTVFNGKTLTFYPNI